MGETDDFEWDDGKDEATFALRAIRLASAARLFDGRLRADAYSSKLHGEEGRWQSMAEIDGRVLFCVWTWRNGRRRVISLRPASRTGANAVPTAKQLAHADRMLKGADLSRFDGMSDDEIRAAWAWDEDAIWPTDEELAEFKPAHLDRKPPTPAAAE